LRHPAGQPESCTRHTCRGGGGRSGGRGGGGGRGGSEPPEEAIRTDMQTERPSWVLSCYGHERGGGCDLTGDVSFEEARWTNMQVRMRLGLWLRLRLWMRLRLREGFWASCCCQLACV
jgi:hypothetical protein